jgi:hypothetical protein
MAAEVVDRLGIVVAVRRFTGMGVVPSRTLRSYIYARITKAFIRRSSSTTFRRFLGEVRREFMQRLSMVLHDTLGYYLRDALHEGSVDAVACLPAPRA